jgi:hypothetical protein
VPLLTGTGNPQVLGISLSLTGQDIVAGSSVFATNLEDQSHARVVVDSDVASLRLALPSDFEFPELKYKKKT